MKILRFWPSLRNQKNFALIKAQCFSPHKDKNDKNSGNSGIDEYYKDNERRGAIADVDAKRQPLDMLEEEGFKSRHNTSPGLSLQQKLEKATEEKSTIQKNNRVVLIQGSSRGLGLEFVRQLLQRDGCRVIATCRRDPETIAEFEEFKRKYAYQFLAVRMDIEDLGTIKSAFGRINGLFTHIDLLVNVAGILHTTEGMLPEKTCKNIHSAYMIKSYQVNAIGPALVIKVFHPLLQAAEKFSNATSSRPSVVANISARVGSIGDNKLGGWYSYRASKAALNQIMKCYSIEFMRNKDKISCINLHPGTVDTDLSRPYQKNIKPEKLFTKERAVKQLLDIIDRISMEDTGKFYAWNGDEIPW